MFVNEHPVTPKHAKMRGDKSPIYPPLTPLPSRGNIIPSNLPDTSSATSRLLDAVGSGLRSNMSRSNSGATKASVAAGALAARDKPNISVDSSRFFTTNTDCKSNTSSSSTGGSSNSHNNSASCDSNLHRDRLARLTGEIQRVDQQQLRLTGISVTLAVGLFYLLLERMGLKQLSLIFSFASYIPFLHVLPALCAVCIVWLRLPKTFPQSGAPSPVGTSAVTSCPATLANELLQKYMSTRGLGIVRESQEVHRRFGSCLLKFLVFLAASDFLGAYVQFWPLLHLPEETKASVSTGGKLAAARPPVFGPPPPGVYREGFEIYPPENFQVPSNSGILGSKSSNSAFLLYAQRAAAVFTYLLRVLAARWLLRAANTVAAGPHGITSDGLAEEGKGGGEHFRKWIDYLKPLPGGAYAAQKICALQSSAKHCCSRAFAKQTLLGLFPALLLSHVWLMPLASQERPSGFFFSSFSQPALTSSYMLVIGLLGLAAVHLLIKALLLFVKDSDLPGVRKLRAAFVLPASRYFPPSSTAAPPASEPRRQWPPVQRACRVLFVVALLLEIFSIIVSVRALIYLFMHSGPQSQPLASAEAMSPCERILVCSGAVAHTLAAFVFASAGTCCGLQNYLISKIFSDGKISEHEVLRHLN